MNRYIRGMLSRQRYVFELGHQIPEFVKAPTNAGILNCYWSQHQS